MPILKIESYKEQLSTTSKEVRPANFGRLGLVLGNTAHGTGTKIFVSFGEDAVINSGLMIPPGEVIVLRKSFGIDIRSVHAIASNGSPVLSIAEG